MRESKVASLLLLLLNGDEQTLEVASSESLVVLPLDHLEEKSRSVLYWLSEDLQQISLFVIVDENLVLLKSVDVF